MELLTVLVIIAILAVILIPTMQGLRGRTYRLNCTQNLKTLHVAATNYMQTNRNWPRYRGSSSPSVSEYEKAIFDALRPFGAEPAIWVCPSIQHSFNNPDYNNPKFFRVDYIATPFGEGEATPFRWSTQPWFAEKTDSHGEGPLVIFPSGEVFSLRDVVLGAKYK